MGGEALAYEVLQRAGAALDEPPSVAALVRALGLACFAPAPRLPAPTAPDAPR